MSVVRPALKPGSLICLACVLPARVASLLGPVASIRGWPPSVGGRGGRGEGNGTDKILASGGSRCWERGEALPDVP